MFLSLRWIKWFCPILPPKIKIWPFAEFGVTGQIRSKLILGIIWFGATQTAHWYPVYLSVTFGSKVVGRRVISHRVVLDRVEHWPDLRLPKWKSEIYTQYVICIHSNISSWIVQNIRYTTVSTARSWNLKPVAGCTFPFDLTWWPDLPTWPSEVKICTQDVLLICAQYHKFLSYSWKTGGRICSPFQCAC